jgi:hypothetical protein
MRSIMKRSLALTTAYGVFLLIGCATTRTTIPQDYTLGTKDESVVIGRLVLDLEKPPLPFFANLMRMALAVRNEATQIDYALSCDRTGLDSEFFASLPPGKYQFVHASAGDGILPFRVPIPRFEVGAGQVQYLGTIRFRGQAGDSSLRGGGIWLIEDESAKTIKSFRERYPRIPQPVVKSAMLEGTQPVPPIALVASGHGKSLNRIVSETFIGKIHASSIIESFKVSPDSKRVAYVAVSRGVFSGEKQFLVVDGREEKQYDYIGAGTVIFSPDSKRVAYGAIVGNRVFLVVDGKEDKTYDTIGGRGPVFSPDSKRVAYSATVGNKHFVVVDGNGQTPYDGIAQGTLIFSPDSKRVAYAAPQSGNKWVVVVDGKDGTQYDAFFRGGRIVFDRPDGFHYLVGKGSDIYLVEETIKP